MMIMNSAQSHQDTRTHVVGELYDTERSYVESLQILVEKYMKPLKSQESQRALIDSQLVDEIFYTIPEILAHHEAFLASLQRRLSSDWDSSQVIGDVFIEAFASQQIIDTYTAFMNNWKSARQAIKLATQAKPAFERYLEAMSRGHRNKLTLDALLIMPVQRIPRYELLIKELIKHTPDEHPDHALLLEAQREIHQLALKIDRAEREMMHQEQLRELETLIDGHVELQHPQRDFIRYDLVTIQPQVATTTTTTSAAPASLVASSSSQGQATGAIDTHASIAGLPGADSSNSSSCTNTLQTAAATLHGGKTKERLLFLFCDLLIMTSVKKKTSRRFGASLQAALGDACNDLTLLEGNKFKLLLRVPLDQLEVRLTSDQIRAHQLQQQQQLEQNQLQLQRQYKVLKDRQRELDADLTLLGQMSELTGKMQQRDEQALILSVINDSISRIRERLSASTKQSEELMISGAARTDSSSLALIQLHDYQAAGTGTGAAASDQRASTSLEFIIKEAASRGHESAGEHSGESGVCESQLVTFASFDRLQAFLHAFIEAKQQRYRQQIQIQRQQQQQYSSQQKMYTTSAILKVSHPGEQQQHPQGATTNSAQRALNNNAKFASVPSGIRSHHPEAPIVHQMSAPQSLALAALPLDLSGECAACHATNRAPGDQQVRRQQQQQHRQPLTHQPMSHPASLDIYGAEKQQQQQRPVARLAPLLPPSPICRITAPRFLRALPMRFIDSKHPALQFTCSAATAPASQDLLAAPNAQWRRQTVCDRSAGGQLWLCMSNGYVSHVALILLAPKTPDASTQLALASNQAADTSHSSSQQHAADNKQAAGYQLAEPIIQSAGDVCKSHINCISQVSCWISRRSRAPLRLSRRIERLTAAAAAAAADPTVKSWTRPSDIVPASDATESERHLQLQLPAKVNPDATVGGELRLGASPPVDIRTSAANPATRFLSESAPAHSQSQTSIINSGISSGGNNNNGLNPMNAKGSTTTCSTSGGSASTTRLEVPPRSSRLQNLRHLAANLSGSQQSAQLDSGGNTTATTNNNNWQLGPTCQHQQQHQLHPRALARHSRLDCAHSHPHADNQSAGNHHRHHHHLHHHHNHQHSHGHHHLRGGGGGRHNTVPLGELRRALELSSAAAATTNNNGDERRRLPANSPVVVEAAAMSPIGVSGRRRVSRSHQQLLMGGEASEATATATAATNCTVAKSLSLKGRSTTPPAGSLTASGGLVGSAAKGFRSARSLRHQASLKTSSILAKLVGSAGRKSSSYLRKATSSKKANADSSDVVAATNKKSHPPLPSGKRRNLSDLDLNKSNDGDDDDDDDNDDSDDDGDDAGAEGDESDSDNNRPILASNFGARANEQAGYCDNDALLANITTPGSVKCRLEASQLDLITNNNNNHSTNQVVVSPLSSVSSLTSTNSSMTVNSVCVSSPNHSSCDLLLAHSLSASCCSPGAATTGDTLAIKQRHRRYLRSSGANSECRLGECAFRSRSATVPSRDFQHQRPSLADANAEFGAVTCDTQHPTTGANMHVMASVDSYKVSEIVSDQPGCDLAAGEAAACETKDGIFAWYSSSLWLGCDDGSLLVIDCLGAAQTLDFNHRRAAKELVADCNNQHSEVKFGAAICDIKPYKDCTVFLALANGQLTIISRRVADIRGYDNQDNATQEGNLRDGEQQDDEWQLSSPKILTVAAPSSELDAVSKLCIISDAHLWYSYGSNIYVLKLDTLELDTIITAGPSSELNSVSLQSQSTSIDNMELVHNLAAVCVSLKNCQVIQLFDVANDKHNLLLEVNLFEPINRMLLHGNDIIRQHKTANIRVTTLLSVPTAPPPSSTTTTTTTSCCTLFVGTSAGIVLYLSLTANQLDKLRESAALDEWRPQIAGLRHGHSGGVKFLHLMQLHQDTTVEDAERKQLDVDRATFLISGGCGLDLYGPIGGDQQQQVVTPLQLNSEEDNLNHMLFWQL